MRRILALAVAMMISSCSASDIEGVGSVRVYYVPIGVETYIPITKSNIDEHYAQYAELNANNTDLKKVLSILGSAGKGVFDGNAVRVKIVFNSADAVYVDNTGGINGFSVDKKLGGWKLNKVKKILERLTQPRKP